MLPDMNSTASGGDESKRKRSDGINNKSSSEDLDNNSINNQELKRKRYHRHTLEQIQEMEAFFKHYPHPNHNQRKELSNKLGLEPLQVKFWFQNKRTQLKKWHEHHKNSHFRTENNELRAENMRCKEALSNARCRACGRAIAVAGMSFNEHCLKVENAQLREQIEYLAAILAKFVGKPLVDDAITPSSTASPTIDTEVARKLKGKQKMEE
ncbi:Homeobox-leucine zipper protein MERISTEM L1 [Sesamum angolense]|uniref:Homeobox-leucine zipper protein MERISTEM L1 n=1 Tax=Sesamum angolense TaxID=2727404 RepID=A0AAE1WR28_9LAMI|nr:Homeobox-leucine zipper protein MERISTEM L1 [Sesamum angolense]